MLEIPQDLALRIKAEGEKAYPKECCGFVLGTCQDSQPRKTHALIPIANAWETAEQYHRFSIEPEAFIKVEQEARAQNLDIIGFYHSHPDHPARPSDYDREQALPGYSYLIVAVEQGRASALTGWELLADRSTFTEEEIIWR
ncbi:MAG: M67 family metallopeptidase [Treponema sp.]|jgi:proteasome lid subunit RPN8/RPN11|nr:M67 family metallopeptidase [Treponema sp.]